VRAATGRGNAKSSNFKGIGRRCQRRWQPYLPTPSRVSGRSPDPQTERGVAFFEATLIATTLGNANSYPRKGIEKRCHGIATPKP